MYLCFVSRRLLKPAIACCLLGLLLSATIQASSEPAFWVASKGAAKVYLFGSMHFGRRDFYPLPDVVEQAFAEASTLVVEVNLLNLGADAQQIVFRHAGLPSGTTLKEVISSETYAALVDQAGRNKVPVSAYHRFQPWYVTLTLVEAEIRKTDLRQQLGIDLYFLNRAAATHKSVEELETLDSQLKLFSSIGFKDQEEFLRQTLTDLRNSQSYLTHAANAWMGGDVKKLEQALIEPFREQEEAKVLFEKMFTRRNAKMASAVGRYLDEPGGKTFMVVGVGHMLGPDGIVALLKSQGFVVRKLRTGSASAGSPTEYAEPEAPTSGLP